MTESILPTIGLEASWGASINQEIAVMRGTASALSRAACRRHRCGSRNRSDPVFAAIEAHKRVYATYETAVSRKSDLEGELPEDKKRTYGPPAKRTNILADIVPTTIAGALALLRYVAEVEGRGDTYPFMGDDGKERPLSFFTSRNVATRSRSSERT
jgi:hypothetical protein